MILKYTGSPIEPLITLKEDKNNENAETASADEGVYGDPALWNRETFNIIVVKLLIVVAFLGLLFYLGRNETETSSTGSVSTESEYTGTSSSCSELQSEFNAAYARSKVSNDSGDLDTMRSTNAQMQRNNC